MFAGAIVDSNSPSRNRSMTPSTRRSQSGHVAFSSSIAAANSIAEGDGVTTLAIAIATGGITNALANHNASNTTSDVDWDRARADTARPRPVHTIACAT